MLLLLLFWWRRFILSRNLGEFLLSKQYIYMHSYTYTHTYTHTYTSPDLNIFGVLLFDGSKRGVNPSPNTGTAGHPVHYTVTVGCDVVQLISLVGTVAYIYLGGGYRGEVGVRWGWGWGEAGVICAEVW